jgi:hypothetical protein
MLPIITTLLTNGLSLIANAVLAKGKDYIQEKTGVDLDAGTLTQEQLVQLKKFEAEHEEELLRLRLEENKLDIELQRMFLLDTDSARRREVDVSTSDFAPLLVKVTPSILALSTVLLTFILFGVFAFSAVKPGIQHDIVVYILGVLSAIATQIYSYYFGSSAGSKDKDKSIERILQQGQENRK